MVPESGVSHGVSGKPDCLLQYWDLTQFFEAMKNMFLPIRDDIADALREMGELSKIYDWRKTYLESFECFLGLGVTIDKKEGDGGKEGEG